MTLRFKSCLTSACSPCQSPFTLAAECAVLLLAASLSVLTKYVAGPQEAAGNQGCQEVRTCHRRCQEAPQVSPTCLRDTSQTPGFPVKR